MKIPIFPKISLILLGGSPEDFSLIRIKEISTEMRFKISLVFKSSEVIAILASRKSSLVICSPELTEEQISIFWDQLNEYPDAEALAKVRIGIFELHEALRFRKLDENPNLFFNLSKSGVEQINQRSIIFQANSLKDKDELENLRKLKIQHDEESTRLVEVNLQNAQLIAEVEEKKQIIELAGKKIQNLLDNLSQGFLTFDSSGNILPGYSNYSKILFGQDELEGTSLDRLLKMNAEEADFFKQWINMLFVEALPFDDLKPIGPKFVDVNNFHIALDFRPIRTKEGIIERTIMIASDKTAEQQLQQKSRKDETMVKKTLTIMRDRDFFNTFIEETRTLMGQLKEELKLEYNIFDFKRAMRLAHTMKGGLGAFHFVEIESDIHKIEGEIQKDLAKTADISQFVALRNKIFESVVKCETSFANSLGELNDLLEEPTQKVEKINTELVREMVFDLEKHLGFESILVQRFSNLFLLETMDISILRHRNVVMNIAKKLEKRVDFNVLCEPTKVLIDPYKNLLQNLIHCFRNALDHGIETPDERELAGKKAMGSIDVIVDKYEKNKKSLLRLRIADDGRGIDYIKVLDSAVNKKLISPEKAQGLSSDREKSLQLVFMAGLSTREHLSEVSGRGVGLDAIYSAAIEMGGSAEIQSVVGKGTTIILLLPIITHLDNEKRIADLKKKAA